MGRYGEPAKVDGAELVARVTRAAACALLAHHWPPKGNRHNAALALAGALFRARWPLADARLFAGSAAKAANDEEWKAREADVASTYEKLAAGGAATGWPRVAEILGNEVADRLSEWLQLKGPKATPQVAVRSPSWPEAPSFHAYHGLVGDIVRAIEPHSEADPIALLIQFLVVFGNVVGPGPHFKAEADSHAMKLFVVLVGVTSKGRKGTSWGHVKVLFQGVDDVWVSERVQTGLSSGEGLIWTVRDPIVKREQVRDDDGSPTGRIEEVVEDPGVEDKRLLVLETELASTLRVMRRETNTLSPLIRQAWDTGDLRCLTKNSPAKATGTHVSIVGHVTRDELIRSLHSNELSNGFANRFLWICTRRSKLLPEGGRLSETDLEPLIARIRDAVEFARNVGEMKRDEEARQIWISVYSKLSQGYPGFLGSVLSRAEAQTMRLACVYALLDCSEVIRKPHLLAALAVWEYVESSARFIFGDSVGDAIADTILDALRQRPEGLTRTEISKLLGNNRDSRDIDRALGLLSECGLARYDSTQTGGRPADRWYAVGTE